MSAVQTPEIGQQRSTLPYIVLTSSDGLESLVIRQSTGRTVLHFKGEGHREVAYERCQALNSETEKGQEL